MGRIAKAVLKLLLIYNKRVLLKVEKPRGVFEYICYLIHLGQYILYSYTTEVTDNYVLVGALDVQNATTR